jgi:hypothetical protein
VSNSRDHRGALHLVGSVPLDDSADVFKVVGSTLMNRIVRIPDGETGDRANWIVWQYDLFKALPDVVLYRDDAVLTTGLEKLTLKEGVDPKDMEFGPLGYADAAIDSYALFLMARDVGSIAEGCKFQVNLPTPHAPISAFFVPELGEALEPAYETQMLAEVDEICASIPHEDLAIQWDVAREFLCLEGLYRSYYDDDLTGYLENLAKLGSYIPDDIELGYHFCYGDFGHKHSIEPKDMTHLVNVANGLSNKVSRTIEWIHMPVPRDRDDDAYFAPLRNMALRQETRLFLGLVHYTDGIEGTTRRRDVAKKVVRDFGLATECGFGRRAPETLPDLLKLHIEAAELL